ncbi:hypothetical protein FQA39_LY16080 [Lamprigera yunnana]|nr:hypothetical protein FQA39_LY16080 [Lamprigera yunnana]
MDSNQHFALNWKNHWTHLKKAFDTLLSENEFVDVTLSCEGKKVTAHKMLLSACSIYFHDLFRDNPCQHPIVILRDVKFQSLVNILKFVYTGEVSVKAEDFDDFLKTARLFQINGLMDDETETSNTCANKKVDIAVETVEQLCEASGENEMANEVTHKRPSETNDDEEYKNKKVKEDVIYLDAHIKEEIDDTIEDSNPLLMTNSDLEEQIESASAQLLPPETEATLPRKGEHISALQKSTLLQFLQRNPSLITGRFSSEFTTKMAQLLWRKLANMLNDIPGPKKNWRRWRKSWHDLRTNAKCRRAKISHHPNIMIEGSKNYLDKNDIAILKLISSVKRDGI